MYIKATENHQIQKYPYTFDDFRNDHKNVSMPQNRFNSDEELMKSYGLEIVRSDPVPVFDPENQTCVQFSRPSYNNGVWVREWEVKDIPESVKKRQIEERLQTQIESVKAQRNGLLARSDWTQISDAPKSIKDKYKTYRKRLRDIPLQAGFPFTIEWPEIEE